VPERASRTSHAVRRAALGTALGALLAAACAGDPTAPAPTPTQPGGTTPIPTVVDTPPTPPREFRGAWIATVANIDWPSRTGLTATAQQGELRALFASFAQTRLNAAVLQIRPAADALYRSSLEPWSRYLTGTQGTDPGYDPLEFAVTEAHGAGLELHAWFNPFRAGNASDTTRFSATHVWRARRDLARVYGTQVWMDPGDPEVQDRTMAVILDVVRRYDVDAVHLDDYFYPYLERDAANRIIDFPDSATYARYNPRGLTRADWRRDNINRFVQRLYGEVHAVKPWVRVGLSPFGIWRPGTPPGITGLDAYTEIYADSRLWLNNGWMDYFAPQLYWRIDPPQQSYTTLLAWWSSQNTLHRHLWPGNATYRVSDGTTTAFPVAEISNQVTATRSAGATGNVFYNTTSLLARSGEVSRHLASTVYASGSAVPPATPWLDATPPGTPAVVVAEGAAQAGGRVWTVRITPPAGEAPRWWVLQSKIGGQWGAPVVAWGAQLAIDQTVPTTANGGRLDAVAVRAGDAVWNLGAPAIWRAPAIVAALP
jgi:uncharacterized lipoprotein YddW (UPF0748 family)